MCGGTSLDSWATGSPKLIIGMIKIALARLALGRSLGRWTHGAVVDGVSRSLSWHTSKEWLVQRHELPPSSARTALRLADLGPPR